MALEKVSLCKWKFALGEIKSCLKDGREVTVPHTWNIEEGTEEYWGAGWYSCSFRPEESWRNKRIQVLFHGVYHDAYVYLNGKEVGIHRNSGYTPFTLELTEYLIMGEDNQLTVKVDNTFSEQMLPYKRSFDWSNDGGIIRRVELLITGSNLLKNIKVTSRPVITACDCRQEQGAAVFGVNAQIDGQMEDKGKLEWELYEGCDENRCLLLKGEGVCASNEAEVHRQLMENIKYWHFDAPVLYTLKLILKKEEDLQDEQEIVFGFRDFHVQGRQFYLNGEPVRLCGTEWMPGSDPAYGMAETKEQLEKMLIYLKESNCIFTRFHWQQDDWVYDWCDRNGMLVQEEIPFWGMEPPIAGEQQWKIFKEQIKEMVAAHRNHPSIIAWGVGNELDGQAEETIQYIKGAVAYTHRLDQERPANYVSNSIYKNPALDGTTDGDVMMINDYIGTWHGDLDQYEEWDAITKKNPDKPIVPAEFGLCEPAFSGGDDRRKDIFLEKMKCYRKYPNIAGTIYFCLNDYRTQMGEDGEGKLKKRVHGSVGMSGERKPSYWAVQEECAPVILNIEGENLKVLCRKDIPCYTVKGYYLLAGENRIAIPDLKPGECWSLPLDMLKNAAEIKVFRQNGNRVL